MESNRPFQGLAREGYRTFRRRRIVESTVLGLSFLLPIVALAIGTGIALRFQPASGWVVPILAWGGIFTGVGLAIRYGLRHRFTYPEFLRHVERRLGLAKNELVNADELEARLSSIEDPLSRGLAAQAVGLGQEPLRGISFSKLAPLRDLRRPSLRGALGVLALGLFFALAPDAFRSSLSQMVKPGTYEVLPALLIEVQPGNVTVSRGEPLMVKALVPAEVGAAELMWRSEGGGWRSFPMRSAAENDPATNRNAYQYTIPSIGEPLEYAVAAPKARSQSYHIQVTEPLRAANYEKSITPPAYTGLSSTHEIEPTGDVSAVVGSRLALTVQTSRSGVRGRLVFEDGASEPLSSTDGGLLADLVIRESRRYRVELTDSDAAEKKFLSPPYRIDAVPDRLPTLHQIAPDVASTLPPEMVVELDADCLDDFGLTRLDLIYRRNDKPEERVNLANWQGEREARVVHPWDLEGIALAPGDVIRYHLELTDNDAVSGPKTVRGPDCEIRFPGLEEMYADVEKDREEQVTDVQAMIESQKELRKELNEALLDLKQEKELSWEKQEALKDLAQRQEQVSKQLESLTKSLDQSLEQMQQAELFSPQMMEKVKKISELAKQIESPEFRAQMEQLKKALEQLDQKAVENALQQMQLSQEDLEQSLDRTLQLLEKMKTEENLDQLVQEAKRLLEEQKQLNEQLAQGEEKKDPSDPKDQGENADEQKPNDDPTASDEQKDPESEQQDGEQQDGAQKDSEQKDGEQKDGEQKSGEQKSGQQKPQDSASKDGQKQDPSASEQQDGTPPMSPEEAAEMQKRQEELAKQLEDLKKQLEELAQQAKENFPQLDQEMQKKEGEQQLNQAQQNMDKASQQMAASQKKSGLKFGRQAEQNLEKFAEDMAQTQAAVAQKEQEDITKDLFKLSGRLVNLSQNQEVLLDESAQQSTRELAERQSQISQGAKQTLDQLHDLGRKSQFLSPELSRTMGLAVRSLDGSTRAFEQGNRQSAMAAGRTSTNGMNKTVIELLETNSQMCNASPSSSCSNPMGKMRSLSAQQEQLNGESQGMMGKGQRLSQSESDRLSGLAARQEAIRRGLEEVEGALGDRKDILGSLDDLAKEMEEVTEEMRQRGEVDERILERQQKILSRLLTAQKSIRREDFDEARTSKTGENPGDLASPPPLADELSQEELLRRGILRGSQDPVPEEFKGLVEDYFQSLAEPE